jgi:hypothetical protein
MAKVISLCSITLFYLSLTGALTRESALKADDPLTLDLVSTLQLKTKTSKPFFSGKLILFTHLEYEITPY